MTTVSRVKTWNTNETQSTSHLNAESNNVNYDETTGQFSVLRGMSLEA